MYVLNCNIVITKADGRRLRFTWCESVTIKNGWRNLTDTCEITLPRNVTLPVGQSWSSLVERNDQITVNLGYNERLNEEFKGYIVRVGSGVPLTLYCEDEMYKLKAKTINKAWKKVTLVEVIRFIAPGYTLVFTDPDINLGSFDIKDATPAKVLKTLADTYGIFSYFKEGILNVGFAYQIAPQPVTYVYRLQQNVADHSLSFTTKDDDLIKIKAISHLTDGSLRESYYPSKDAEGGTIQVNYPEMTQAELDKYARAEWERARYDGYKGALTGFGFPVVRSTDAVDIEDLNNPDNRGRYLVDEVELTFDTGGYRRRVELGRRVLNG